MTTIEQLTLTELFKAKDAMIILRDLGFDVEPELGEVCQAIFKYREKQIIGGEK